MQEDLRIGIIGLGYIGLHHLKILQTLKNQDILSGFSVALVFDPYNPATDDICEKYQVQRTDCIDDILEGDGIDVVYVASPIQFHKEQAVRAIQANKAVYCEKPMGLNLDESAEMAEAARKSRTPNQVGLMMNHSPMTPYLKEIIGSTELGKPREVYLFHESPYPFGGIFRTGWRSDPAMSSGLFREANIHDIDLLMNLFGKCEVESAYMNIREDIGEDYVKADLSFSDDVKGFFETQWYDKQEGTTNRDLRITFENGKVVAHSFFFNGAITCQVNGRQPVAASANELFKKFVSDRGYPQELKRVRSWYCSLADYAFIKSLKDQKACTPDFEQGLRAEGKVEEIHLCAGAR